MKHLFPIISMTINLLASTVYLINQDYPRAFYWICAFGITTSTLFIK
jgi:hypothetical protein